MAIVYDRDHLRGYISNAVEVSEERPVLIDSFLDNALEVDVDCISDGHNTVVGGIMEHVELAGVHSGDSACVIPAPTLSEVVKEKIRQCTIQLAAKLNVCGLMNAQYAIREDDIFVLEVNPRASRTVPFVSKAIGVPLAKLAALVMSGFKLKDLGFIQDFEPRHISAKEAVFPFAKFPGVDVLLSPEMKSTGEVMGIDLDPGIAFLKSQLAAGNKIPTGGNVFISVRNSDKQAAVPLAGELAEMGFCIYAKRGTSAML